MKLLTTSNTKTMKGEKLGFMTFIMHLAPASLSGHNVCPGSSAGCRAACLNTAGRGRFTSIQQARVRKTKWFFEDRPGFLAALVKDVELATNQAKRAGLAPSIRLNGTSDIRWETIPVIRAGVEYPNIMEAFPGLQFYDYTKLANRRGLPKNYHLTFSRSESNDGAVDTALANGMNVAVVFDALPDTWRGIAVVDGDVSDLRFLDRNPTVSSKPVIVGLKTKGKAKQDSTGFVVLTKAAA